MSKEVREFFEELKAPEKGGLADLIMDVGGKMWDAATPAFELGAEELIRVVNTGNAYVFHGDTIPHEMQHDTPAIEPLHKEQEGRGIEM
jgi:hypothetical protein